MAILGPTLRKQHDVGGLGSSFWGRSDTCGPLGSRASAGRPSGYLGKPLGAPSEQLISPSTAAAKAPLGWPLQCQQGSLSIGPPRGTTRGAARLVGHDRAVEGRAHPGSFSSPSFWTFRDALVATAARSTSKSWPDRTPGTGRGVDFVEGGSDLQRRERTQDGQCFLGLGL